MSQSKTLLEFQLEKSGLNNPENWFGDPRNRLIDFLEVLVKGSQYYFKINTGDSQHKILELWREGGKRRTMGIEIHPAKHEVGAFMDAAFYDSLRSYIVLPNNRRQDRKQPHIIVPIELIWLIIRVATDLLG